MREGRGKTEGGYGCHACRQYSKCWTADEERFE